MENELDVYDFAAGLIFNLAKYKKMDFDRSSKVNRESLRLESLLEKAGLIEYKPDKTEKGVWLMGSHYELSELGKQLYESMGAMR